MIFNKTPIATASPSTSANLYFKELDETFSNHNWIKTHDTPTKLIYSSPKNLSDQFIITLNENDISVSIPVKNSKFNYKTNLSNYFTASEYVMERLNDFQS